MALPRAHHASFTPGEVEFIAGDETVKIIPKTKLPRMRFIQVKEKRSCHKSVSNEHVLG